MKLNKHFFVLTGGPGVGKTSVLRFLRKQEFECIREAARVIIKEQSLNNDEGLPWKKIYYKDLMLNLSVKDYLKVSKKGHKTTFFDRGIPDTLAYAHLEKLPISKTLEFYSYQYRYNSTVFIFPPWKQIYTTDSERKQQFEEVIQTHEIMLDVYKDCGYSPIVVPKVSVEARTKFILEYINKERNI